VAVFRLHSLSAVGTVFLSLLLAGCSRHTPLPPVIGAEGQAEARTAFEQLMEALESGNQDKVWDGLSARSQSRIGGNPASEGSAKVEKTPGEKAKAVELLRKTVGRKPKVKDVRGTRTGVEIEFEYAAGKTRDLEMVSEDGAWKLNLFTS
jgi:hypothetical protein